MGDTLNTIKENHNKKTREIIKFFQMTLTLTRLNLTLQTNYILNTNYYSRIFTKWFNILINNLTGLSKISYTFTINTLR